MKITKKNAKFLFEKYKINKDIVSFDEWVFGLNVELEHGSAALYNSKITDITNNDIDLTAKIVIAHLLENPRYYYYLEKMEKEMDKKLSKKKKINIFII